MRKSPSSLATNDGASVKLQGGGGMPVAPEQLCAGNFFNHPGITENRVYGEMLARTFL